VRSTNYFKHSFQQLQVLSDVVSLFALCWSFSASTYGRSVFVYPRIFFCGGAIDQRATGAAGEQNGAAGEQNGAAVAQTARPGSSVTVNKRPGSIFTVNKRPGSIFTVKMPVWLEDYR
jgi:hypothetical protein